MKTTQAARPPQTPSAEGKEKHLPLANEQGDAYLEAIDTLATKVAEVGSRQPAGEFLVALAVEKPEEENAHLEIAVLDGADRRFVPGLSVRLTIRAGDGTDVGAFELPFLWHPWVYHHGKNVMLPGDGRSTFGVHIDIPTFPRSEVPRGARPRTAADSTSG